MNKSIALLFDVSTERGIVGIYIDRNKVFSEELPFGNLSSKYLLPAIEKGFLALGIHSSDLAYVGVGVGPGSYTGIRLGAVVAKTLAFACKIPLIGVCTMEVFTPHLDGPFAVVLDAKISGVYIQKGVKKRDQITKISDPEVVSIDRLKEHVSDVRSIVTPNAIPLRKKIIDLEETVEWIDTAPNLDQFEKIAFKKYTLNDFDREGDLKLIYLRKTQAEIERES